MVSIIIPCRNVEEAKLCIEKCLKLDYPIFEVIVLPDEYNYRLHLITEPHKFVIIKPTGKILPSRKRDIGIKEANGKYIAFIDADAYPDKKWLKIATGIFEKEKNKDIAGVCGPGLLPPDSSLKEKAADWILRMLPHSYRVVGQTKRCVEDYPTFNLIIKKEYIDKVGGFNCEFLTGEDTLLCKKIIALGKKILYYPYCIVYHKRRALYKPFLKQISIYAIHRGYFFKKYPETSRKLLYILPSIGVVCCIFGFVLLVLRWLF